MVDTRDRRRSIYSSRRTFLKNAATGVAAAAAAGPLSALRAFGDIQPGERKLYDYIVIGSGAGGGTVAVRLAQRKKHVLLIEAGGEAGNRRTEFPMFDPREPTAHAWATEDQKLAWAFYVKHYKDWGDPTKRSPYVDTDNSLYDPAKRGILYPRGSTMGGSTAVNAMITLYPDGKDWDWIGENTGDPTWNAHDMYHDYFNRFDAAQFAKKYEADPVRKARPWLKPWFNSERANPWLIALGHDTVTLRILYATIYGVYYGNSASRARLHEFFKTYTKELALDLLDGDNAKGALDAFKADLVKIYQEIDPNTWEYVSNMTDGMLDIPRATLQGRRWGTRDLIEGLKSDSRYSKYLEIQSNCFVKKLLFAENGDYQKDGRRFRVAGIEWVRGARLYGARIGDAPAELEQKMPEVGLKPGGELILAGGSINTPQLLMLSGVGPWDEMPNDVPRVVNLPGVGRNLQDRYEITVIHELEKPLGVLEKCKIGDQSDVCYDEWSKKPESAIYGSNGALAALAKTSTPRQRENGTPDMIIFALSGKFPGYTTGYSKNVVGERSDDPASDTRGKYLTWAVLKGHTDNQAGVVKLRSSVESRPTSCYDTPYINFHSFDEGYDPKAGTNLKWRDDVQAMLEGTNFVRGELREKLKLTHFWERRPGWTETLPRPGDATDGESTKEWVRKRAWGHHACGTAPMGRSLQADPLSVVNSQFQVHGVRALRIVDASVFKRIPGLFIVVPTYLMAEKAADAIGGKA